MRAFDIICVVVLTRLLLLTSNVSSTPTTYSTSNPHSLISGDTHDGIRALRVSDESSTQERGLSNLDPILKLLPWTDAYTAAKVSKLKNSLQLTQLTKDEMDKRFESLLLNEHFNRQLFINGITHRMKPKHLRSLLSQHIKSKDDITKIIDSYTEAYKDFKKSPRQVRDAEASVMKIRKNEAESVDVNVLGKTKIYKRNFNDWMNSLLTENDNKWVGVKTLLEDKIKPDDIRQKFWVDKTEEDEIDPFLEFYTAMYEGYKAHPLMNENPSQAADEIVEDTTSRIAFYKNSLQSVREGKQEMGKEKERMFKLHSTINNKVDDFLFKRYLQELNELRNDH